MIRRPPRATRTATLFPSTAPFRSQPCTASFHNKTDQNLWTHPEAFESVLCYDDELFDVFRTHVGTTPASKHLAIWRAARQCCGISRHLQDEIRERLKAVIDTQILPNMDVLDTVIDKASIDSMLEIIE